VGLVSLAILDPGALAPNARAYGQGKKGGTTVNVLPQLTTTVSRSADLTSLNAVSTLGGASFAQVLGVGATPNLIDPTCPILDLHLGPIDLNLLGLEVTTSQICLAITAHPGGGLLGDLLCGLANALNAGIPLGDFLGSLTASDLSTLLNGLTGIINGALQAVTTTAAPGTAGASTPSVLGTTPGACDILNLSLGPIDLTLLGLEVVLDNCDNGPVTVDITAIPSGGLLGQLLCGLDNLLNSNAAAVAILNKLTKIAEVIAALI